MIDGLFLRRSELVGAWDFSIFLDVPFFDVPFEVAARRMAERDACDPDVSHASLRRYVGSQLPYFAACDPQRAASLAIDNSVLDRRQVRPATPPFT